MTLAAPKLDDRHFQDIVDEAKKRIPHYCKEWTDHNVSDPGVTLIELFAWMTDLILYRLNQVPDLHYIKFLDMLGIQLRPPIPAQAPVTFWLSAPQVIQLTIPAGTEVSSTQTEKEISIVFTTDADLRIDPPELQVVFSHIASDDRQKRIHREINLRSLEAGEENAEISSPVPSEDDALYLGFTNDLSSHLLGFVVDFDPACGAGVDPNQPPYVWEAATGKPHSPWQVCDIEEDSTRGMNSAGNIKIHVPQMGKISIGERSLYWIRARHTVKDLPGKRSAEAIRPFITSPRLQKLSAASWGGTVPATHARLVQHEFLGRSDGSAGQRFQLQSTPILQRLENETLILRSNGHPDEAWKEVSDFAETGMEDHCFTLNSLSGELRLPPAIRQPDGTIKLYGAIPTRGANLMFERYRVGGGQNGNVQAHVLNTCKTSIPYVDKVSNRKAAEGGLDAETLEAAMVRVPAMLRSRERAVTESDYEYLAHQALPAEIGRVKCLQPRPLDGSQIVPGQVYVLVIPRVNSPAGYIRPDQLSLRPESVAALSAYLDERRLLTTRLEIRPPEYQWVAVKVALRILPGTEPAKAEAEVLAHLYRFLNPLIGGPDEKGWPFGRSLYIADIYQCLQGIPQSMFIRSIEMYRASSEGEPLGDPCEVLELLAHCTLASGRHTVQIV